MNTLKMKVSEPEKLLNRLKEHQKITSQTHRNYEIQRGSPSKTITIRLPCTTIPFSSI